MVNFLLRKITRVIAVILGAVLITFLLMHAVPGNPWTNYSTDEKMMINIDIQPATVEMLAHRYGFDLPLWRQFTRYVIGDIYEDGNFICGAICGNLGPSMQQRGRTVNEVLFAPPEGKTFWQSRFGYSIRLVFFGAIFAAGFGILLGILSGIKPNSPLSRVISLTLAALISIPNFVLGLLVIIVLASWLSVIKVLPDWSDPVSWIVPALVLAVMPMANIARVTQATLVNIMNEDYIRTARGKGASEARVMRYHVLRNAAVPVITYLGPTLIELFTGLFIVESLYAFPGLGREYWIAILRLDYPIIMGLTIIYAVGIVLVNIFIEIISEILDPRLRAVQQQGAP